MRKLKNFGIHFSSDLQFFISLSLISGMVDFALAEYFPPVLGNLIRDYAKLTRFEKFDKFFEIKDQTIEIHDQDNYDNYLKFCYTRESRGVQVSGSVDGCGRGVEDAKFRDLLNDRYIVKKANWLCFPKSEDDLKSIERILGQLQALWDSL